MVTWPSRRVRAAQAQMPARQFFPAWRGLSHPQLRDMPCRNGSAARASEVTSIMGPDRPSFVQVPAQPRTNAGRNQCPRSLVTCDHSRSGSTWSGQERRARSAERGSSRDQRPGRTWQRTLAVKIPASDADKTMGDSLA